MAARGSFPKKGLSINEALDFYFQVRNTVLCTVLNPFSQIPRLLALLYGGECSTNGHRCCYLRKEWS